MLIERLIVEGGFLSGLDLAFSRGINTIIGGRGTGKTSIIELLRFALSAPNFNEVSTRRSKEHALAILQDGQVTVVCSHEGMLYHFRRTANTSAMQKQGAVLPIIFSQTDIETLGIQGPGRISLIDSFSHVGDLHERHSDLASNISSITAQMQNFKREIEGFDSQLLQHSELTTRVSELASQETAIAATSSHIQSQTNELRAIADQTSRIQIASDSAQRVASALREYLVRLQELVRYPPNLDSASGPDDPLAAVRQDMQDAAQAFNMGIAALTRAVTTAETVAQQTILQRSPLDAKARELRSAIEGFQQGAGTLSREASNLRERLNQLNNVARVRDDRAKQLLALQEQRGLLLDTLDRESQARFERRTATTKMLDARLAPGIRLTPIRSGQVEAYAATVANALRGSGLKYNDISVQLANRMSPRELIETVERGDIEHLCSVTDITQDRALKVVSKLRDSSMTDILTTQVEDDVQLSLLDGLQYKTIDRLSTGQRCTVILPIVMEHVDRTIVVDQPEDHLDNAFITDTLIRSLSRREQAGQIIFSTHNANIPVLGEADTVIHMGSDGQRAFVEHIGPLDDPETVHAITTVMEGGHEAFRRRAEFYASHPPQ